MLLSPAMFRAVASLAWRRKRHDRRNHSHELSALIGVGREHFGGNAFRAALPMRLCLSGIATDRIGRAAAQSRRRLCPRVGLEPQHESMRFLASGRKWTRRAGRAGRAGRTGWARRAWRTRWARRTGRAGRTGWPRPALVLADTHRATSARPGSKPLKYPAMFRSVELVAVNKVDLIPHLDYDLDAFYTNLSTVNPGVKVIEMSARTGAGIDQWCDWLLGLWPWMQPA